MAEKNRSTWKSDKDGMFGSPPVTNANHDPLLEDFADSVLFKQDDADWQSKPITINTGDNYTNSVASPLEMQILPTLKIAIIFGTVRYNTDSMPTSDTIATIDDTGFETAKSIIGAAFTNDGMGGSHDDRTCGVGDRNITINNHESLPNPGGSTTINIQLSVMFKYE